MLISDRAQMNSEQHSDAALMVHSRACTMRMSKSMWKNLWSCGSTSSGSSFAMAGTSI